MTPNIIELIPPTLPGGDAYCFTSSQQLATDIINNTQAILNPIIGLTPYNYGDSTPSVDKRTFPWFRTVGGYPDGWYQFLNGYWLRPNPFPSGDNARHIWVGSEADLLTYDGGEAGAVGIYSGPMWQIDHTMDGRFPIGAATLPITSLVIAVNSVGGEEMHTLTLPETPAHTHNPTKAGAIASEFLFGSGIGSGALSGGTDVIGSPLSTVGGDIAGATTPHNNLPPYIGVYWIKRTARIFYRL